MRLFAAAGPVPMHWYYIVAVTFCLIALLSRFLRLPVFFSLRLDKRITAELRIAGIFPVRLGRPRKRAKQDANADVKEEGKLHGWISKLLADPGAGLEAAGVFYRLVRRVLRGTKLKLRLLEVTYGSGNPFTTAMALGRFYSLVYSVRFLEWEGDLNFTPDFMKKRLEGKISGTAYLNIARITNGIRASRRNWTSSRYAAM